MDLNRAEIREFIRIAVEGLGRYRLRTSLSVLGVVLGVAAVIAMMSVSEGAARQALAEVESLGIDNLVVRSHGVVRSQPGLSAGDADQVQQLVPLVQSVSPLINRFVRVGRAGKFEMTRVLGVRPAYQEILRLTVDRGRFLSATDEKTSAHACVLGPSIARQLFGYRNPLGERVRIGSDYYEVIGVLSQQGADPDARVSLTWYDFNEAVFVPFPTLSGRTLAIEPHQPADEIWLRVKDGKRANELAQILEHAIVTLRRAHEFDVVVPRELLAQRTRTQRTFSVVVGSVAVLALIVGGIGVMNIMLTSVVERTREIGVRRTVGATRREITVQFLIETLLMTLAGGAIGIITGAVVSQTITAFAGWATHVSVTAIGLGFSVSFLVGIIFGLYPAIKAARLEPVDAMRYE